MENKQTACEETVVLITLWRYCGQCLHIACADKMNSITLLPALTRKTVQSEKVTSTTSFKLKILYLIRNIVIQKIVHIHKTNKNALCLLSAGYFLKHNSTVILTEINMIKTRIEWQC